MLYWKTCKIHVMMSQNVLLDDEWPSVKIHWTDIYFTTYSLRLLGSLRCWSWVLIFAQEFNKSLRLPSIQNDYLMAFQICYYNILFFQQVLFVSLFSLLLLNSYVWDYFQPTMEIVNLYSAAWVNFNPLECVLCLTLSNCMRDIIQSRSH